MSLSVRHDQVAEKTRQAPDTFPEEVWRLILSYLVPNPPPGWTHPSIQDKSWKDISAETFEGAMVRKSGPLEDYMESQQSLLLLSCAAKGMAEIVEPFLYHSPIICSGRGLGSLDVLLENKAHLGRYVKRVTCLVDLEDNTTITEWYFLRMEQVVGRGVVGKIKRQDVPMRNGKMVRPVATHSWAGQRKRPVSAQRGLQNILSHSKVTDLCCAPGALDGVLGVRLSSHSLRTALSPQASRLRCLRLLGEKYATRGDFDQVLRISLWLPDLEDLEVACNASASFARLHPLDEVTHLKHLKLHSVRMTEKTFVRVCDMSPKLETLLVHFRESGVYEAEPPERSLNEALLARVDTLRSLELMAPGRGHFLARTPAFIRDPRLRRMTCLPNLTGLRHLVMDFSALFGRLDYLEPQDVNLFPKILPPSLVTFRIVCTWPIRHQRRQCVLGDDARLVIDALRIHHQDGLLPSSLRELLVSISDRRNKPDALLPETIARASQYFSSTPVQFTVYDYQEPRIMYCYDSDDYDELNIGI